MMLNPSKIEISGLFVFSVRNFGKDGTVGFITVLLFIVS